jgi:hypothetical protein
VENQSSKKLTPWFLARLIFDPEDGSHTSLRNFGSYTDYTAVYFRIWKHSELPCENLKSYIKILVPRKMLIAELQKKIIVVWHESTSTKLFVRYRVCEGLASAG